MSTNAYANKIKNESNENDPAAKNKCAVKVSDVEMIKQRNRALTAMAMAKRKMADAAKHKSLTRA